MNVPARNGKGPENFSILLRLAMRISRSWRSQSFSPSVYRNWCRPSWQRRRESTRKLSRTFLARSRPSSTFLSSAAWHRPLRKPQQIRKQRFCARSSILPRRCVQKLPAMIPTPGAAFTKWRVRNRARADFRHRISLKASLSKPASTFSCSAPAP